MRRNVIREADKLNGGSWREGEKERDGRETDKGGEMKWDMKRK